MDSATSSRSSVTDTTTTDAPAPTKRKRAPRVKASKVEPTPTPAPEAKLEPSARRGTICDLVELRSAAVRLANVCDLKSYLPILGRVHVRYEAGALALTATDLNVALTVTVPATSDDHLDVTLDAKILRDLLKVFPTGDAVLTRASGTGYSIDLGVGDVVARLFTIPSRDFPKIERASADAWITIDTKILRGLFEDTLDAVCKDETRFHLNGILVESTTGETLRAVSTDGHRLVRATQPHLTTFQTRRDTGKVAGVIVPSKGAREIIRLLDVDADNGTCEVAMGKHHMFVRQTGYEGARGSRWTLAVKLIDADFPPYEQVIPKSPKALVTVDRLALIDACKRAKVLASDTRGMRLKLANGKLVIETDHPDAGDLCERLEASYWDKHDGLTVGLRDSYLAQALAALTCERVQLGITAELDPITVRDADDAGMHPLADARYVAVVMPMRI